MKKIIHINKYKLAYSCNALTQQTYNPTPIYLQYNQININVMENTNKKIWMKDTKSQKHQKICEWETSRRSNTKNLDVRVSEDGECHLRCVEGGCGEARYGP